LGLRRASDENFVRDAPALPAYDVEMKSALLILLSLGAGLSTCATFASETNSLNEHLEFFRPYLGKTWRGEFKESKPDKPVVDVARWERVLNGQAIRVTHSLNDGVYGGESLMIWDGEKKELRYFYFTTAGFHTSGTLTIAGQKLTAIEQVSGNTNGIVEVRSTTEIQPSGIFVTKATYLNKAGETVGGREAVYQEDPKAEVKFK